MSSSLRQNYIVWIDMEMTGLDVNVDHILEIACIITDKKLNFVSKELNIVIHQSDTILENMTDWCKVNHSKSGLTQQCRTSTISLEEAEKMVLQFLKEHISENSCPLAGSSVYIDRFFLNKYMPLVNNYLHYRIIDVSTIKELARRWNDKVHLLLPKKRVSHRALDDIKGSINELKYYRSNFFRLME